MSINTVNDIYYTKVHAFVEIYILDVVIFLEGEAKASFVGKVNTINVIAFWYKVLFSMTGIVLRSGQIQAMKELDFVLNKLILEMTLL